jgi:tetratricopeptide (TPR) repeat protein
LYPVSPPPTKRGEGIYPKACPKIFNVNLLQKANPMSHIHEALKKAQKDRDVRNLTYSGILAASRRKSRSFGRKTIRWVFPIIIVILLAFFYDSWLDFRGLQTPDPSGKEDRRFQTALNETGPDRSQEISPGKPRAFRLGESQTVGSGRPQAIDVGELPTSLLGPPQGTTLGPPQGTTLGPPQGTTLGPPQGTTLGPPQPIKLGPQPIVADKPEATYERARRLHMEGRLEEAKRLYEETLRLDPGHVDTLNNLGVILIRKRDYLSAQRNLEKAVRLKPRDAEPFYNLACLKAITGDTKKAMAYLQKAVSLDPTVRDWAQKDADLETLRQLPEFKELI